MILKKKKHILYRNKVKEIQKPCGQDNLWIQYKRNNTVFITSVLFMGATITMTKTITTLYPTEMQKEKTHLKFYDPAIITINILVTIFIYTSMGTHP